MCIAITTRVKCCLLLSSIYNNYIKKYNVLLRPLCCIIRDAQKSKAKEEKNVPKGVVGQYTTRHNTMHLQFLFHFHFLFCFVLCLVYENFAIYDVFAYMCIVYVCMLKGVPSQFFYQNISDQ